MLTPPSSLRDRAAQLVFPRLGSNMTPAVSAENDADRVARLLEAEALGGLVLFHGDRAKSPDTLRRLQQLARYPLLVASDLERGSGQQLHGGPVFPHAMAFGACGDRSPAFVHHAAWLSSRDALAAGVHWLFAPVADVHSNPENPIIATRAFATDPVVVADLVQAFVAGCREGGGLATAKHFPGHGDTATDSHAELPVVARSREALEATELVPFRAAIDAGVDAIMTAHVRYSALDDSGASATESRRILRDVLRGDLGFDGVVVSDSLLMAGAGAQIAARAPAFVAAGVDVLLDLEHPSTAIDAIVRAVENGSLPEADLDAAFRRVWRLKERLASRFGPRVFLDPPQAPDAGAEAVRLSADVAAQALQESGEFEQLGRVHVVVVRPHTDYPDPTQASIEQIFQEWLPGAPVISVGPSPLSLEQMDIEPGSTVVVAAVVKPAAWRAFGLLDHQERLIDELIARFPTALAVLGSPDTLARFPRAPYRLCSFSDVASSVEAAARRIAERLHAS